MEPVPEKPRCSAPYVISCHQIWRIVKIEDPEEIWVDRPTVQTVEARPQAVGTDVRPYTLADGVDDAMRMSPDYLVIGEVRDGIAAMSLVPGIDDGSQRSLHLPCRQPA